MGRGAGILQLSCFETDFGLSFFAFFERFATPSLERKIFGTGSSGNPLEGGWGSLKHGKKRRSTTRSPIFFFFFFVFRSTFFGYFFCIFRPFRIYRVSYCVNIVVIFILVSFSGYGFGAWGPQTCLFRLSFFLLIPAFFYVFVSPLLPPPLVVLLLLLLLFSFSWCCCCCTCCRWCGHRYCGCCRSCCCY